MRGRGAVRICPVWLLLAAAPVAAQRPPAVPLVVNDPYFSIWSMADQLYADATRHWTGTSHSLSGIVRIDGSAYRIMGAERNDSLPVLPQRSLSVQPEQTIYGFEGAGTAVSLTFTTPMLPRDPDLLSWPVTYLSWSARATDGKQHTVQVYFDASSEIVVNTSDQLVYWSRLQARGLNVLRVGSREQPVLQKSGDNVRIDWGYLYLAVPEGGGVRLAIDSRATTRKDFVAGGAVMEQDAFAEHNPRVRYNPVPNPVLAASFDFGDVGSQPKTKFALIAYDDLYSLEYLDRRVRPYWRRTGWEASDLLQAAVASYAQVIEKCNRFDRELMADLVKTGGREYAQMCALSYRQAIAAHKVAVDGDGTLLFFPKENFSGANIDTVDVFYPSAPLFLLLNPKLLRGSVEPILHYASMPRWPWPYAPHDLGTYPLANGQTYGGGEKDEHNQMPVEESGNMLLLVAAIAKAEDNAGLAEKYWPLLTKWAEYLRDKGLDPENQLCTDDFAGHLARNANLSLKAIEALGGYSMLAAMMGRTAESQKYRATALDYAQKWMRLADDGDHYMLAFGRPGSWSQKYNLVWDRILGLNLFPPEVPRKEIAYYKTKQNRYGLPLDNRADYTKLDWLFWSATLAENIEDFQALTAPAYKWMNETPSRVPLTDWYFTTDGQKRGFQARSVVGGLFMKMLADPAMWAKWRQ